MWLKTVGKFPVLRESFFAYLEHYSAQHQHKDLIPNAYNLGQ